METEQAFPPFDSKTQLSSRQGSASNKCDGAALACSSSSESQFFNDREEKVKKNEDFIDKPTYTSTGEENCDQLIGKRSEERQTELIKRENCARENGFHTLFPDYPSHGVIGKNEPVPVNLFFNNTNTQPCGKDFKKQKFDFYEMYEKHLVTDNGIIKSAMPLPGLGYLCRGFNTANIYKIDPALPVRFRAPDLLRGYGCERQEHPLFRTTSSQYGKFGPTVHDVPHEYHGLKNAFTGHLSSTGMPKNRSLNIK